MIYWSYTIYLKLYWNSFTCRFTEWGTYLFRYKYRNDNYNTGRI